MFTLHAPIVSLPGENDKCATNVSIPLKRKYQTESGVVYAPELDKFFKADVGMGATQKGNALHVSTTRFMQDSLSGSGFPYSAWKKEHNNSSQWAHLIKKVVSLRCDGAAALDLCLVAEGILDGFWELDLDPWDLAAGH